MPAPRDYPASPPTHLTASATYGEAVQSNVFYVMPTAHPAGTLISGGNRVFGVTLSTAAGWHLNERGAVSLQWHLGLP